MLNKLKLSILLLCLAIWVIGCRDPTTDFLNIEKIDSIEIRLITEVGENDGHLFGRLRDLLLLSNGNFFVSDWEKMTIEQFNNDGNFIGSITNKGNGPGELSSFFLLFDGGSDTLLVRQLGMNQKILEFSSKRSCAKFTHVGTLLMEDIKDHDISFMGKRSDSEFYGLATKNNHDLRSPTVKYPNYTTSTVAIVNKYEKILQDSLHLMSSPNPVAEFNNGAMLVIGMPPYQSFDRFRMLDDGRYLIAYPDSSAIYIFDGEQNLESVLNLKFEPRQVNDADVEKYLSNVPHQYHDRLIERIPEIKPPFDNLWASKNHIVVQYDKNELKKDLIIFNLEGDPLGKFYISNLSAIKAFENNLLYTIHRDPEKGDSIRIYEIKN